MVARAKAMIQPLLLLHHNPDQCRPAVQVPWRWQNAHAGSIFQCGLFAHSLQIDRVKQLQALLATIWSFLCDASPVQMPSCSAHTMAALQRVCWTCTTSITNML